MSEMMSDGDEENGEELDNESPAPVGNNPPYGVYRPTYDMNGEPVADLTSFVYPEQTDQYAFPPGMAGTFIPESVIYGDYTSSDSDAGQRGQKHGKHRKKKRSKKSKKKESYNYYTDDGGMMIVPEKVDIYSHHRAPPSAISGEGPFESHLPEAPVDHYVVEDYDPAWHYNLKSYIREQQHVNGYTDPVSHRPYESHIDEFPPADYSIKGAPYDDDDGPYERRLPGRAGDAVDPKMLNRNFILRQSEDYRRRL